MSYHGFESGLMRGLLTKKNKQKTVFHVKWMGELSTITWVSKVTRSLNRKGTFDSHLVELFEYGSKS